MKNTSSKFKVGLGVITSFAILICVSLTAVARDLQANHKLSGLTRQTLAAPNLSFRIHKVGDVSLTVRNNGIFGYQVYPNSSEIDPETGLPAPGCVFPTGSGIWYLYSAGLWLGAVVGTDTLVSTGIDGWARVNEFFPDDGNTSTIVKRSIVHSSPYYSPQAVSEEDYVSTTFDTLSEVAYVQPDPFQGRPHRPLGVKVVQESYAWSSPGFNNFVIVKERITNIGQNNLQQLTAGIYLDTDVGHTDQTDWFADDVSGSIDLSQELGVQGAFGGWSADNDGDHVIGDQHRFQEISPLAAIGIAFLSPITPAFESFNWWISNRDIALDWGPVKEANNHPLGTGAIGTPSGDPNKYFFMNNHERDYDQFWAGVNQTSLGWLQPNVITHYGADIANGWDARFLLSQNVGNLAPGDSTEFVFVVAVGNHLHTNPAAFDSLFDYQNPSAFYNNLNFEGLRTAIANAKTQYGRVINGMPGDPNFDYMCNISDAVFLIQYVFNDGIPPNKPSTGDANSDCEISLSDIVYLINYIFAGGPAPLVGCSTK